MAQKIYEKCKIWLSGLFVLVLMALPALTLSQVNDSGNDSQAKAAVVQQTDTLISYKPSNSFLSPMKTAPMPFTGLAAKWYENQPEGTQAQLYVRFLSVDGWTPWHELQSDIDYQEGEVNDVNHPTAFIVTNRAVAYQYKVELSTNNAKLTPVIKNIEFTYINAKGKVVTEDGQEQTPEDISSKNPWLLTFMEAANLVGASTGNLMNSSVKTNADSSQILTKRNVPIISRSQWGADESLRFYKPDDKNKDTTTDKNVDKNVTKDYLSQISSKVVADSSGKTYLWPLEYSKEIDRIIIHHTASSSNLTDPKQAIRNIYYYHTVTREWGDIGYNYIIDQQGNIYEGRYGGEGVVGAHASGANVGSIGIAVLGNYQDSDVPDAVIRSLALLIKEKVEKYGIDPDGSSYVKGQIHPNIMGHRDVGETSCPGENLYAKIPLVRQLVKEGLKGYVVDKRPATKKIQDYNYDLSKPLDPISLKPGDSSGNITLTINLKNTGSKNWNSDTYLKIYNNQDFIAGHEIRTDKIGKNIAKGQTASFSISIDKKSLKDKAIIQLIPVLNGKSVVEKYIIIPVLTETPVSVADYGYQVVSIKIPDKLAKGQASDVVVTLKNTGAKTWVNSGKGRITIATDKPFNRVARVLARPETRMATLNESSVKPGETGTFTIKVKAPQVDGYYREDFVPALADMTAFPSQNSYLDFVVGNGKKPVNLSISPSEQKRNTVAENSDKIRVGISFSGDPIISASGKFALDYSGKGLDEPITIFAKDEQVKVTYKDNKFQIQSQQNSSKQFSFSTPPRFIPESGAIMRIDNYDNRPSWKPEVNDNQYRGKLEVFWYDNSLKVVNELYIEEYLKGLAEISAQDPYEKIKAVITLARSYATYYVTVGEKFPGAPFDLTDDPERSQKYLGYSFEMRNQTGSKAVDDTTAMVVKYKGSVIKTPYFSSDDGRTRSAKEVWGWTDTPYLQSVDDPGCKGQSMNGHGVGLSGCGSRYLANQGKNYKEIIQYYFQGVDIDKR